MGNADRLRGQKKRPGCDEARFPPVCSREGEFHSSNQRIGIGCRPGGSGGHSTTRISRMAISNDGTLQFAAETNTGIYLSTKNSRGDQTSPRSSRGEFASGTPSGPTARMRRLKVAPASGNTLPGRAQKPAAANRGAWKRGRCFDVCKGAGWIGRALRATRWPHSGPFERRLLERVKN